jgi:hypothetical protein
MMRGDGELWFLGWLMGLRMFFLENCASFYKKKTGARLGSMFIKYPFLIIDGKNMKSCGKVGNSVL